MDDEQILARGGTEEDIIAYSERNGANLTEKDFMTTPQDNYIEKTIEEFRKTALYRAGGCCWECCDYESIVNEVETLFRKALQDQRDLIYEQERSKRKAEKCKTAEASYEVAKIEIMKEVLECLPEARQQIVPKKKLGRPRKFVGQGMTIKKIRLDVEPFNDCRDQFLNNLRERGIN